VKNEFAPNVFVLMAYTPLVCTLNEYLKIFSLSLILAQFTGRIAFMLCRNSRLPMAPSKRNNPLLLNIFMFFLPIVFYKYRVYSHPPLKIILFVTKAVKDTVLLYENIKYLIYL
jgi:hypothetical protein